MKQAKVIVAGLAEHPQSGSHLLCIETDRPWAEAGERWPPTEIWCEATAPVPSTGEPVAWDGHHVWLRGVRYRKPEYDRNPAWGLR